MGAGEIACLSFVSTLFHSSGLETEYAGLRAEAAVHAQLRNEAFQKASAAYAKKQGELAGYYASQGHRHTEKMKEANRRAAEITFRQK